MALLEVQTLWLSKSATISVALGLFLVALSWKACIAGRLIRLGRYRIGPRLPKMVLQRVSAWTYLFDGPNMIQQAFDEANGQPFELFAPDTRYVFVSSFQHITELDNAPDTVLSLQAASKQMLQPKYTMHGFNWFDRRGTEGVGFVRALRTLLTKNLPQILPDLGIIVKSRLDDLQSSDQSVNGARHIPIYRNVVEMVVLANAVSLFGKELAKNEQFMVSALRYIEETILCAELVRLVPRWIAPVVGSIIAHRLKSHEAIFNGLIPVAEQRCRERDLANLGQPVPKHDDCIQWIMETSPRQNPWSAKRVVHELMAIWFGSVHALSTTITFAIHDLCLHPEYAEPLRNELQHGYDEFARTGQGLPLLDSFIKESARMTPVESMSTRRHALQPFTLSNGTKLAVGDWVCTPVRAIMQHPDYYPEPLRFNGFRFVDAELLDNIPKNFEALQPKRSRLTDVGKTWHVWGTGRMACPGRFYAAAVMKVILGQIIMNYDCGLVDLRARRWVTWRSSTLPKQSTLVKLTPR